jgi:hypothetical protein
MLPAGQRLGIESKHEASQKLRCITLYAWPAARSKRLPMRCLYRSRDRASSSLEGCAIARCPTMCDMELATKRKLLRDGKGSSSDMSDIKLRQPRACETRSKPILTRPEVTPHRMTQHPSALDKEDGQHRSRNHAGRTAQRGSDIRKAIRCQTLTSLQDSSKNREGNGDNVGPA